MANMEDLLKTFPGIQTNIPLSHYTTTQVGGPAKYFIEITDQDELVKLLNYAHQNQITFLVIGGGSDILVADTGIDSLVIKNSASDIKKSVGSQLTVQAGTPLQNLVDYSIENGLNGLHKLTGIPGTVGGAIFGNAGAYGQTISDHLHEVKVWHSGQIETISKEQCHFGYRDSDFKNNRYIILEATFQPPQADTETLKQESTETLAKRLQKYPPGIKCPGSFFKNILAETIPQEILDTIPNLKDFYGKVPSWYFLQEVGAKGDKLGGVEIASFHANLFENKDHATANDFYQLAKKYAQKVKEKFGIQLEPEVQLINLSPLN